MTLNDPPVTSTPGDAQVYRSETLRRETHKVAETKPSFLTTEFWMTILGIAALVVIYNVADNPSLDLWRTCLLGALGVVAYVVSRGLAKSGSRRERWTEHDRSIY